MSRESVLVLLGLLVILSPFAGLPLKILVGVLPVLGALVTGISLSLRRSRAERMRLSPFDPTAP